MTDQDQLKLEMRLVGGRVEKVLMMIGKIWNKRELFGKDRLYLDRQVEEVSTMKKGCDKVTRQLIMQVCLADRLSIHHRHYSYETEI